MASNNYQLVVKKGSNPGHAYPIFANHISIGRDPMSDIIFKDPEVSRKHARFTRAGESYELQDLGSTNGTFVDGERLAGERVSLTLGQEVAFGGAITLIFQREEDIDELINAVSSKASADELSPDFVTSEDIVDPWVVDSSTGSSTTPEDQLSSAETYEPDYSENESFDSIADKEPYSKEQTYGNGRPGIDHLQPIPKMATASLDNGSQSMQKEQPIAFNASYGASQKPDDSKQMMTIAIGVFLGLSFFCIIFLLIMYFSGGSLLGN